MTPTLEDIKMEMAVWKVLAGWNRTHNEDVKTGKNKEALEIETVFGWISRRPLPLG